MYTFRSAIESRDIDGLLDLLSPQVVFRSPVVFREYVGRDLVAPILRAILGVVDEVTYTVEIGAVEPRQSHALMFEARVAGKEVEGCDIVRLDEDGCIAELVVIVRPLTGAIALAEAMEAALGRAISPA
jgi:hypothetical protein